MIDAIRKQSVHVQFSPPLAALLLSVLLFLAGGVINPNFLNVTQAVNIVRLERGEEYDGQST